MDPIPNPRIVHAEVLKNAIVVAFDDGQCALFPAPLLYAIMPQAQQFNYEEADDFDS